MAKGWVEPVKTAVLAGLILLSLGLTAGIWRDEAVLNGYGTPGYVVPGNSSGHTMKDALAPRLILHKGGTHYLIDAGRRDELDQWVNLAAGTLASRSARLLQRPVPAGDGEILRLRRAGVGLELVMPVEIPLSRWLEVWGYQADGQAVRAAGSVPVQRIVVFGGSGGGDGPGEAHGDEAGDDRRLVVFLGGSQGRLRLAISEEGEGRTLAQALRQARPGGQRVRMITAAWQHVTVAPGVFVPENTNKVTPYRAVREPMDGRQLADAVFPDPGMVRRVDNRDGSTLFTDGQGAIRISQDGFVEYSRPGSSEGMPRDIAEEIDSSVGFLDRGGGWPDGASLWRAAPGAIEFTYRVAGLPVFIGNQGLGQNGSNATGTPAPPVPAGRAAESHMPEAVAPLRLQVSASGVLSFARSVWRAVAPTRAQQVLAPEDAVSAFDLAISKGELGVGSRGKPVLIRDIYLAYLLDDEGEQGSGHVMRPVWIIEDGEGHRIPIDAADGALPMKGRRGGGT